jgi:hypothetical protein
MDMCFGKSNKTTELVVIGSISLIYIVSACLWGIYRPKQTPIDTVATVSPIDTVATVLKAELLSLLLQSLIIREMRMLARVYRITWQPHLDQNLSPLAVSGITSS